MIDSGLALIRQLHHDELFRTAPVPDIVLVQATAYLAARENHTAATSAPSGTGDSLWTSPALAHRRFSDVLERTYKIDGRDIVVRHTASASGKGGMSVEIDGVAYAGGAAIWGVLDGEQLTELTTHLPDTRATATVIPVSSTSASSTSSSSSPAGSTQKLHLFTSGAHYILPIAPSSSEADLGTSTSGAGDSLTAPMPARVLEVKVKEGDEVKEGQVVCVLESMKMEINIRAGRDGKVESVGVAGGGSVEEGQVLVRLCKVE